METNLKPDKSPIEDILGIKPVAESLNTTVNKTFEGVEAFLKRTSLPLLDELGFWLRDKVRYWRLLNVLNMLEKAQGKILYDTHHDGLKINPRIALEIVEEASKIEDEVLQDMWAGLFTATLDKDGCDDSNMIFVTLLKQLTSLEVKILNYVCEHVTRIIFENGFVISDSLTIQLELLAKITGTGDVYNLDLALDHLSSLDLIGEHYIFKRNAGFTVEDKSLKADVCPTPLALSLHARCTGYKGALSGFYKEKMISEKEWQAILKSRSTSM